MKAAKANKSRIHASPEPVSAPSRASLYELLFNEANDALLLVNAENWTIQSANKKMQELTGYLQGEIEGAEVANLYPEKAAAEAPVVNFRFRGMRFQEKMLMESGFYEDVTIRKKDGYLAYVTLSVRTLSAAETGDHPVTLCILRDIAAKKAMERDLITKHSELKNAYAELERAHIELKAAQEALVQAGKLAALGELAAGVAHELNQPLTGIMGFAQELEALVKEKLNDKEMLNFCAEIHKNGVRMNKIIKQLREFTRKSTEDFQQSDVVTIIEESLKLLDAQFKLRGITVKIQKQGEIPKIYCNPFKIEQVFINLATNARDAIEEKGLGHGEISITVKWPAQMSGDQNGASGDRFVEVVFSDNGCGMSELTKSRAFDPFFTTKEVGSGTGLGLSLSYGILSQIHATMMIESTLGKGSTFHVRLPVDYRNLNITEKETNHGTSIGNR